MDSNSDPAPSPDHPLVVLVDDDPALLRALKFALELEGFRVHGCPCGEDLLNLALPGHDTCLVIDERLPGITGLAALDRLRSQGVGLPALLITTHPNAKMQAAARCARTAIVEKPLLGDSLVRAIRAALA